MLDQSLQKARQEEDKERKAAEEERNETAAQGDHLHASTTVGSEWNGARLDGDEGDRRIMVAYVEEF